MNLEREQIVKLIQTPKNASKIANGLLQSQRLEFHITPAMSTMESNLYGYFRTFNDWAKSLLPSDKYVNFMKFLLVPYDTNEFTSSLFNEFQKIFIGENRFMDYEFKSPQEKQDFDAYRRDVLKDWHFWSTKGFEMLQTGISSVLVIDLPAVQKEEEGEEVKSNTESDNKPAPYYYFVPIKDVIDIDCDVSNNCNYLIFEADNDRVGVYDDKYIRFYSKDDKGNIKPIPDIESEHGLGYTPARMFWSQNTSNNTINKVGPLTKSLSQLDWLLFYETAKKYVDSYGPFPIYTSYEFEEEFKDGENKEKKDAYTGKPISTGADMTGPGSYITVPAPRVQGDVDLNKNPINIVSPDVLNLEYITKQLDRLMIKIRNNVCGKDTGSNEMTAQNEMQVQSGFESKESVLMNVKANFEIIHKFANDTVAKLRYKSFMGSTINYGTIFYLKNYNELIKEYAEAKKESINVGILQTFTDKLTASIYRYDERGKLRIQMIQDLDPFPFKTEQEVLEMNKMFVLDEDLVLLKLSLPAFIRRFERENIAINEFGKKQDYNKRIQTINKKLIDYVKESKRTNGSEPRLDDENSEGRE